MGHFPQTTPLEIGIWFASLVGKVAMNHDFLIENLGQPASKSQVPYVARAAQGWFKLKNSTKLPIAMPHSTETYHIFQAKKWSKLLTSHHHHPLPCRWGVKVHWNKSFPNMSFWNLICSQWSFTDSAWNVFVYDVVVFGEAEFDIKSKHVGLGKTIPEVFHAQHYPVMTKTSCPNAV